MTVTLPHALTRTVRIGATPDVVFGFFTDSERWARWWGAGSTIDPRPGGRVVIRYPNAVEAAGEVLAIEPPRRLDFTFGYTSGEPIPAGASRVSIVLEADAGGTRLHLTHAFSEPGACEAHAQGWRYQLAVFANAVADVLNAGAADRVDAWFAAWQLDDDGARSRALAAVASPAVSFRDRFSLVDGIDDLVPHIAAPAGSCRASWSRAPAASATVRAWCWPTGRP